MPPGLNNRDGWNYCWLICAALGVCNPGCQVASNPPAGDVSGLIEQLKNGGEQSRAQAAEALGELGPRAKDAIPALARALRDEYEQVRRGAAASLAAIGADQSAIPDLVVALKDVDAEVRESAARALGSAGSQARAAVPSLGLLLKDPSEDVRQAAAEALGKIRARP
jgi:HEAT repeat protein